MTDLDHAEWMYEAERMWFGSDATVREIADATGQPLEDVQQYLAEATRRFLSSVYQQRLRAGGFL